MLLTSTRLSLQSLLPVPLPLAIVLLINKQSCRLNVLLKEVEAVSDDNCVYILFEIFEHLFHFVSCIKCSYWPLVITMTEMYYTAIYDTSSSTSPTEMQRWQQPQMSTWNFVLFGHSSEQLGLNPSQGFGWAILQGAKQSPNWPCTCSRDFFEHLACTAAISATAVAATR